MTLHVFSNHQCPSCEAWYIPYDDVPCPQCEAREERREPFIAKAAASCRFNLRKEGSYTPAVWYVSSYGDHLLCLLFQILETHRQDSSTSFPDVARRSVEAMKWGEQPYGKEYLFALSLRLYEELQKPPSAGSGRWFQKLWHRLNGKRS